MKAKLLLTLLLTVVLGLGLSSAWAQFPSNPTWTTVFVPPSDIEGLTGDNKGNFYVVDRGSPCKVWKINATTSAFTQVGQIISPCRPSG